MLSECCPTKLIINIIELQVLIGTQIKTKKFLSANMVLRELTTRLFPKKII
jgi:hypothetical protein